MVDKLVEIGILFDFYGRLLTEKQYLVIELYYLNDLSLSEIGDEVGVTRQGVSDLIKRAEQNLKDYEKTLGLVEKFYSNNRKLATIKEIALEIKNSSSDVNIIRKSEDILGHLSKITIVE